MQERTLDRINLSLLRYTTISKWCCALWPCSSAKSNFQLTWNSMLWCYKVRAHIHTIANTFKLTTL